MPAEYFYAKGGSQLGPCTPAQIKVLVETGQLTGADLIWKEGMAEWVPIASVPGLARYLPPATPGGSHITAVPPPPADDAPILEEDEASLPSKKKRRSDDDYDDEPRPRRKKRPRAKKTDWRDSGYNAIDGFFANTPTILLVLFSFCCCSPVGAVLGIVGMAMCQDRDCRQTAGLVLGVSIASLIIGGIIQILGFGLQMPQR